MPDTPHTDIKSKSQQTKKNIIHSYLSLIPNKCWDKITVKELCEHANITRGTFYQYYSDIYDLMEHIENELLDELNERYQEAVKIPHSIYPAELFEEKFDYSPPQILKAWFWFCKRHKMEMAVLLDPKNGDVYFVKKLKHFLEKYIHKMMDNDGLPKDALRNYFIKLITEMHFLSARSWLEADPEEFLSTTEIINLINTMRVGANYLHYRQATSEDFDDRMKISEEHENC